MREYHSDESSLGIGKTQHISKVYYCQGLEIDETKEYEILYGDIDLHCKQYALHLPTCQDKWTLHSGKWI